MDYLQRLNISYYKTVADINKEHNVFLVKHQETGQIYIKKILDIYNPEIFTYLSKNHIAGTPRIIATCEENNQLTVIEEYISGLSLKETVKTNHPSVATIIAYICELCSILNRLHSQNPSIVHRDIKPSNIIITPCNHVILIDFNAAKYQNIASTSDTVLLGTQGYAAPEQYGFGSSTPQTDIYAVGILLKELLSDIGESSKKLDDIIAKCTKINPNDRYQNVTELKQSLENYLNPRKAVKDNTKRRFLPPGYRSLTWWKMLIATFNYIMIFWICLTLEVEDVVGISLWIERIFSLAMMFAIVLCTCNYCNIWRIFPLCRNKHPFVRFVGVLLLDTIVTFILFSIMFFILQLL